MNESELRQELERLKIANQNKIDLISISAHELRSSLTAVKWAIKMLMDEEYGKLSDEQYNLLKRVSLSANRMIALVNDVLTLNHADDSIIEYAFQPFNITEMIDGVMLDFESEAKARNIKITYHKPAEPVTVNGDGQKLRVVVQNLIENAIKYCEAGDRISVELELAGEALRLIVKDGGIGIPAEEQEHIFDKFYRTSNAMQKEKIGSGLGLYTAKRIIEKHGGAIAFVSEEGKGTTFTVTLPVGAASLERHETL